MAEISEIQPDKDEIQELVSTEEKSPQVIFGPKKANGRRSMFAVKRRRTRDAQRVEVLQEEVRTLRKELSIEPLTGLHNLRSSAGQSELNGRLEHEARSAESPSAMFMYIDFDGLHPANKLYGSESADKILKKFGEVLGSSSRGSDYPFREGTSGDEFGIVFFDFSTEEIEGKIQEINEKFVEALESLGDDPEFSSAKELPKNVVSFSAGVTEISFTEQEDDNGRKYYVPEKVFGKNGVRERAEGMYKKAKDDGRNRFVSDISDSSVEIRPGFVPPERTAYDNLDEKSLSIGGVFSKLVTLFRN